MAFIMPWIRPPARYCQRFLHLSSLQVFRLLSPLPKRALLSRAWFPLRLPLSKRATLPLPKPRRCRSLCLYHFFRARLAKTTLLPFAWRSSAKSDVFTTPTSPSFARNGARCPMDGAERGIWGRPGPLRSGNTVRFARRRAKSGNNVRFVSKPASQW